MCHVPFVYRNTQNICFLQKRTQNWKSSEGITIDHSAGSREGRLLYRPHSSVGLPLSCTPTNNEYRQDICYLEGVCCGQIVYGRCMPFYRTGNDVLKGQEPNGVCSGFSETKSHWVRVSEVAHSLAIFGDCPYTKKVLWTNWQEEVRFALTQDTYKAFTEVWNSANFDPVNMFIKGSRPYRQAHTASHNENSS